jgi:hypothetical protein
MKCPKCNFEQPDGEDECMKCGVVFAKYLSKQTRSAEGSETGPQQLPLAADDDRSDGRAHLKYLFFYVDHDVNMVYLIGRALLFLMIATWGLKFIFSGIESNYAGNSFMHFINLPFHEAGHVLFRVLGRFMMTLGGSLMQLLVPLVCLIAFLVKTRDPFAASVSLWWLGESLMDIAPYVNDARALKLILLGGVTGKDVDDYHDWEFILRKTGLLEYDHLLAVTAHIMGTLLMLCAFAWGGFLLLRQLRSILQERDTKV